MGKRTVGLGTRQSHNKIPRIDQKAPIFETK